MTESGFVLVLGALIAAGMLLWGLSGVFSGRIRVKSYGLAEDGNRRFSREILRSEEPLWFWMACCTYMAVGVAALVAIAMIVHADAAGAPTP